MVWAYIKVRCPAFTRVIFISNSRNVFVGSMMVAVIGRVHPTWVCQGEPLVPSVVGRVCTSLSPPMFIMPMAHCGTSRFRPAPRSTGSCPRVVLLHPPPPPTVGLTAWRISCVHASIAACLPRAFLILASLISVADAIRMAGDVWPGFRTIHTLRHRCHFLIYLAARQQHHCRAGIAHCYTRPRNVAPYGDLGQRVRVMLYAMTLTPRLSFPSSVFLARRTDRV